MNAETICRLAPVIPVLPVEETAHIAPLARVLSRGGSGCLRPPSTARVRSTAT